MLHLIFLDKMLLLEGLDGVDLLRVPFLAEDDFAIGAGANQLNQIEIINLQTAVLDLNKYCYCSFGIH